MKLKLKKLHPDARVPTYGTDGAAAFDLKTTESATIAPRHAQVFGTGLAFELPPGHALFIFSRSGDGFKRGLRLANSVGIIDSDYRGEVKVALHNDSLTPRFVDAGERVAQALVAQALVLQVPEIEFEEVEELTDTERGAGGFGSTGK